MWVIALGRLGMREFDLASDADLVFVLADSDRRTTWTSGPASPSASSISSPPTPAEACCSPSTHDCVPTALDGPLVQTESVLQGILRARCRGLGRHHVHEVARRGRRSAPRRILSCMSCRKSTGSATARAGRSRTDLKQMRMKIEARAGRAAPAQSRPRRLLRHRFHADVPAPEERRRVLQSAEHAGPASRSSNIWTCWITPRRSSSIRLPRFIARSITASGSSRGTCRTNYRRRRRRWKRCGRCCARWTPIPLNDVEEIRSRVRALFEKVFG